MNLFETKISMFEPDGVINHNSKRVKICLSKSSSFFNNIDCHDRKPIGLLIKKNRKENKKIHYLTKVWLQQALNMTLYMTYVLSNTGEITFKVKFR